jgi:hypothetical protein
MKEDAKKKTICFLIAGSKGRAFWEFGSRVPVFFASSFALSRLRGSGYAPRSYEMNYIFRSATWFGEPR